MRNCNQVPSILADDLNETETFLKCNNYSHCLVGEIKCNFANLQLETMYFYLIFFLSFLTKGKTNLE